MGSTVLRSTVLSDVIYTAWPTGLYSLSVLTCMHSTTLAKKIETTALMWHRRVICRACTRLCLACVPVSILLAAVVVSLCWLVRSTSCLTSAVANCPLYLIFSRFSPRFNLRSTAVIACHLRPAAQSLSIRLWWTAGKRMRWTGRPSNTSSTAWKTTSCLQKGPTSQSNKTLCILPLHLVCGQCTMPCYLFYFTFPLIFLTKIFVCCLPVVGYSSFCVVNLFYLLSIEIFWLKLYRATTLENWTFDSAIIYDGFLTFEICESGACLTETKGVRERERKWGS